MELDDSSLIVMAPIGVIRSPYHPGSNTPHQGLERMECIASIELYDEYIAGAADILPGSWGIIVFYFDRSEHRSLTAFSQHHQKRLGIFSTRSPHRPNGIGLSAVRFVGVDGARLEFRGADMFDGTPVLDIKPYDPSLYPQIS